MKRKTQSQHEFRKATQILVGGVNSPVRAHAAVGGAPLFFQRGKGAYLFDVDGKRYIDYCLSWGALILGHAHSRIARAIARQSAKGTSFGACTPYETELALRLQRFFPSCTKFRFTNSGTEAVMTAIRLARGLTGKNRIIKFEGCYHGHSDSLLVKSGSGMAALGQPTSKGITSGTVRDTLVLPYNDEKAIDRAFSKFKDIGCVIMEPIAGNMGVIPAQPSFIRKLRTLTQKHNSILIFDEVITGFRAALGGAQSLYGIAPDLTTFGKVIGGGMPIGAVGGPSSLMGSLAPDGPVYQAGTLSGNPLCMAAGNETLRIISENDFFKQLTDKSRTFVKELASTFAKKSLATSLPAKGSLFGIFFLETPPSNFSHITKKHVLLYKAFFQHMLAKGIYFPPSPYEAMFISSAHSEKDFEKTLDAVGRFRPRGFGF